FFLERVDQLPPTDGYPLREKIARLYVERLNEPAEALAQLRRVYDESYEDREARRLLEVILATETWPGAVRRGALELLRARYQRANQPAEIVRVLRAGLGFADTAETIALHREIGGPPAALGRGAGALGPHAPP